MKKESRPIIAGINGIDGSGKSTFCLNLSDNLKVIGIHTQIISVDDFHNPKSIRYKNTQNLAESYFYDSFNFKTYQMIRLCL